MKNPSRTKSGVAPIAVMVPPRKCPHGTCVYCPSLNVPQSYTPKSPAVLRAKIYGYDPKKQVERRIEQLKNMGHEVDKIEIIVMGGTFLDYAKDFQNKFIKGIYDGLNGFESENLEDAKKNNEMGKHRCVALCIETRPDFCSEEDIQRMLKFGCTRVELGVQILDDEIYEKINRGHKVKDVVEATKRLKENGFKVGYHIMLGLPGSSKKKDLEMFDELFEDERFKPDHLKIYPCQVLEGSELKEWYERGAYEPMNNEELKEILLEILPKIPRYCRVMRVMREIPPEYLVKGMDDAGVRSKVEKLLENLKEIRSREAGRVEEKRKGEVLRIKKTEYFASGGKEIFLEYVDENDVLYGLLRLRICKGDCFVRELHVYGSATKIGNEGEVQHRGIGGLLLREAEKISKKHCKKLKIISGVGVREYYRKKGYFLEEEYMVKEMKAESF